MNQPAIDFYRDKGVDLYTQPSKIALCAQHNNGGIGIDCWWQTDVKGLFAVGEAAASHGVYRPGGTALNAGQVGSTRAAQYIAARCQADALLLTRQHPQPWPRWLRWRMPAAPILATCALCGSTPPRK